MDLDLILQHAAGWTADPSRPRVTRVGVLQGRIVGLDDALDGCSARTTIDLGGRTLLPGFVDAHNHLAWTGLAAGALDLTGVTDITTALALIESAARTTPEGGWIDVVGYDQRPFGRHLTRADLDAVAPRHRVYLIHASGHAHLVNSAVLDDLPTPADPAIPGVVTDEHGRPTGLFLEDASRLVSAVRTPYALAELTDAVVRAGAVCAAQGITFVAEAGVGGGLIARSPVEMAAYQNAIDSGRFGLRAQLMPSLEMIGPVAAHPDDQLTRAFPGGLRTGFGSDRLALGPVKTWLDGGMMARTAALTEPYVGTEECGALAPDLDEIAEAAVAAHAAGWQLALHAIGDRAVDAALTIVEWAQQRHPRPDARHRIEHCGLVRPDQLPRLAAAGIVAVSQPTFLHAFGDDYAAIMGPARAGWMYRGRSYLASGIPLAGSSDRPVADGAPLRGIQFLVERRSHGGAAIGPDEAVDVEAALYAYTMGGAFAGRVEDRLGSITPGKYADFTVLDGDPFSVPSGELADIPITATVVGGELVHGDWPA